MHTAPRYVSTSGVRRVLCAYPELRELHTAGALQVLDGAAPGSVVVRCARPSAALSAAVELRHVGYRPSVSRDRRRLLLRSGR